MAAVKKSVSLPQDMLEQATRRAKKLGWTLSRYVQKLVEDDLSKEPEYRFKPKQPKGASVSASSVARRSPAPKDPAEN